MNRLTVPTENGYLIPYLLKKELSDVLLDEALESLADAFKFWFEWLRVTDDVGGALSDWDGWSGGVAELLLMLLRRGLSLPLPQSLLPSSEVKVWILSSNFLWTSFGSSALASLCGRGSRHPKEEEHRLLSLGLWPSATAMKLSRCIKRFKINSVMLQCTTFLQKLIFEWCYIIVNKPPPSMDVSRCQEVPPHVQTRTSISKVTALAGTAGIVSTGERQHWQWAGTYRQTHNQMSPEPLPKLF